MRNTRVRADDKVELLCKMHLVEIRETWGTYIRVDYVDSIISIVSWTIVVNWYVSIDFFSSLIDTCFVCGILLCIVPTLATSQLVPVNSLKYRILPIKYVPETNWTNLVHCFDKASRMISFLNKIPFNLYKPRCIFFLIVLNVSVESGLGGYIKRKC